MPESRTSPYPGLRPYTDADQEYFYGRNGDRLVIAANFLTAALTVVYGPSGAGKSSLLDAAVAPDLLKQRRTKVIIFRKWSGADFLHDLKSKCAEPGARSGRPIDIGQPLDEILIAAGAAINGQILVILDQFEEYLQYNAETEADGFESQLAQAVNRDDVPANFLIAIREDWYFKLERFRRRIPSLFRHSIRVSYLDDQAAREAIQKPVEVYDRQSGSGERTEIEKELVDEVIRQAKNPATGAKAAGADRKERRPAGDATGQAQSPAAGGEGAGADGEESRAAGDAIGQPQSATAGAKAAGADRKDSESEGIRTPLLQLMMSCVWEEEKRLGSHRLRRSTLDALGGAAKIFTRHLDQAMAALGEPERQIAARLFDYMVTPSGSKIAHTTRDLVSRAGAEPQQVTKTLEKLAAQRIVRGLDHPDGQDHSDERDHSGGYEIFHDVLGPAILDWVKRYEKRRRDRAHRRLLLLAGILLLYFAGTITGMIVYWVRARNAQEGQRLSASRELALRSIGNAESGDPELALMLALQGLRIAATPEGDTALNRALASSRVRATLSGHTGAINRIAVSADGTRIATASADQTVRLWDSSGKPLRTLTGHRGAVTDVAFNGDGTTIASASEDGFIGIWEAESGQNLRMLQNDGPATALAYAGRSKVLAVGSDNGLVRVWDIEAGRALATWRGHTSRVRSLSFSPDERLAASGSSDGTIRLWDARSGKLLKSATDTDQVWSVAFSRDGLSVLASGADGLLKLLPVQKNLEARRLGKQPEVGLDLVSSAVYDGSGTRIAYGGWDHAARVVNAGSGQATMVLRGHRGPVLSVVFAPREQRLYTASQDSEAKIWDVSPNAETQDMLMAEPNGGALSSAAFDPKGNRVATGGLDGRLLLWGLQSGEPLATAGGHNGFIFRVAFNPSGAVMASASADHTAVLRDGNTGQPVAPPLRHGDTVAAVTFSPDGRSVATASWDKTAAVWDASTGKSLATLQHRSAVSGVAFAPDSKLVATACLDGSVHLWEAAGRELHTFTGHNGRVYDVAFAPDGKQIATAGEDGTVRLWNVASRRAVSSIAAHNSWVHSVAFSPDGRFLLSAGRNGEVRVWEAASGKLVFGFSNSGKVYQAVFSADGKHIAWVGEDGTLRVNTFQLQTSRAESIALARTRVTRAMTADECQQYLSGFPCPDVRIPEK